MSESSELLKRARSSLAELARLGEAVRFTAGLSEKQWLRIMRAKDLIADIDAALKEQP